MREKSVSVTSVKVVKLRTVSVVILGELGKPLISFRKAKFG